MRLLFAACLLAVLAAGRIPAAAADAVTTSHGLSLFGDLKYGPDFKHFDYVNPEAPKGGSVRYAAVGTFDTLNPYQLKGNKAAGLQLLFDTLMAPSYDEPSSEYGLIAGSVELPADRRWVQYNLRPEARFQDGSPITPEDVIWTFDTLRTKGDPHYRLYYADVVKAEKVGEHGVKFTFRTGDNRELADIVGQLPVLPRKILARARFREDDARPAARQRPLQDREFRCRPLRRLSPCRRLLGQGSAGQPRALQFRRDPLRFLSRPADRARSLQGRRLRHPRGVHLQELGDRL